MEERSMEAVTERGPGKPWRECSVREPRAGKAPTHKARPAKMRGPKTRPATHAAKAHAATHSAEMHAAANAAEVSASHASEVAAAHAAEVTASHPSAAPVEGQSWRGHSK
jgi:hypothetical protein